MIKEVQKKFKKIDKELKKEDSLGKYFIGHGEIKSILTGVLLAPHNFSKYYDLIYSPLITELEKFNKKLKAGVYRADVTASRLLKEIFVSCLPRKEKKSWYGGVKKPGRETLEREINRFKEDVEKLIEFDYSKLEKENRLSLWSKIIGIYLTGTGVAYGIEKYYGKEETTSLVVIIIMYSALGGLLYYKWDQTGERILKWLEPDNWKLNE